MGKHVNASGRKGLCDIIFQSCIWLIPFAAATNINASDPANTKLDAHGILNKVAVAYDSVPQIAVKMNSTFQNSESDFVSNYNVKYYRDKRKIDLIYDAHESNGSVTEHRMKSRVIWDGNKALLREERPFIVNATPAFAVSFRTERKAWATERPCLASYSEGIIAGDRESAVKIMLDSDNAQMSEVMESINGFECYKVSAVTPHGKYDMWVDPEHGFLPRKIFVQRQGADISWGHSTGDQVVTYQVDALEIEKIDGHYVITKAQQVGASQQNGKETFRAKYTVSKEEIDLNPDFKKLNAFIMDGIPDGARVINPDVPGMRYIWRGDAPVLDIGSDTVESIDNIVYEKVTSDKPEASLQNTESSAIEIEDNSTSNTTAPTNTRLSNRWTWGAFALISTGGFCAYALLKSRRKKE